jgi:Anti-sigma factor NepR
MITDTNFVSPSADQQRNSRYRQRILGGHLRRVCADVAAQPVPENFLHLLEQADQRRK